MKYQELKKLYYGDRELYQDTYQARFSSENTITLNFDIDGHPAFFVQCEDVIRLTYEILKLDKIVYHYRTSLPNVALNQYTQRCLIDEIVVTNNIEGVHSSRKEIGDVLRVLEEQSGAKGRKNVFWGLVNKYSKLMKHDPVPLHTCQDIRNIYDEIVMKEVVSEDKKNVPDGQIFRREMTEVYNSVGKSIHKGKYPESAIIEYMEKALAFLNNEEVLPLYRICLFHYMLEYIHPFYDGNGRLGRFILSYCISENLDDLLSYRISETIKENIKKYYDAFKTCNDKKNLGDLTPFLIMMLEMIKVSMESLIASLKGKTQQWIRYLSIIPKLNQHQNEMMENLYHVLIQASLFSEEGISTQELLILLNTNYTTLGKRLAIVKKQGLLETVKQGNKKYYSFKLDVLESMDFDNNP